MALSSEQIKRYARHLLLKDVGGQGQEKLLQSRVLIVGAGGLGAPLVLYLAAAGVGTIGIVDYDTVDVSNLQRQVIHKTSDLGRLKTDSAAAAIKALNPDVTVETHAVRLAPANALELVRAYDLVADGSDTFATRILVNDACYFARRPLISAAVGQYDGQLSTFKAYDRSGAYPCYRCLFPEPPPPGTIPTCAEAGILGALAGVMGAMQAMEVLKELLGLGDGLAGRLLLYDGLGATMRTVRLKPDPACALCGADAAIRDLSSHG